jgi:hypothetical protein
VINQACLGCHNDKLKSGGFSWSGVDLAHPEQHAEQVEKAVRYIRAGLMPPSGAPRPERAVLDSLAANFENAIDRAAAQNPNPGRPSLHRMNRSEYTRTVRDLLAIDIDSTTMLPPDDSSHGFDNMADALTFSPALMEGYIRAAGRVSRLAVGDKTADALTTTYSVPRVLNQMQHITGTPIGTRGGTSVIHNFPADGEYTFKVGFYYSPTGPLYGLNQGKGQTIEIGLDGARLCVLEINPAMRLANDGIKTPAFKITAGPHRISAAFPEKTDGPLDDEFRMVDQSLVELGAGTIPGLGTLTHLHEFSVTGPINVTGISDTPSRRRIFTCRPKNGGDEVPCAKQIIASLARQAYRRPVNENDLEALLGFFQNGRNGDGNAPGDFESGIRTAIQAILASPEFVFRFERAPSAPSGPSYRISDLELATRLSYFIWSTAPDEALTTLAAQNKLHEPAVLEQQVRRMVADPRSETLSTNFAFQWLHLQNVREANPDLFLYPDYDKSLALAMVRESELLFDSLVREDRNILDLLTADYTFVNQRLAKHYRMPNVLGDRFRRVPVADPNRYGILGHGSVLMLTSTATRTSPVQRGKYVMEVLLGTPPPPPPAVVPALPENAALRTGHVEKFLTVRERLEEHRKNPTCAGCHAMMDPLGFALENFDATGLWRINDSGFKIDANGKMFDGTPLDGPVSLRKALLNRSDAFINAFTESLLAYGLGRVIDYRDMPAVRAITHEAARNNNKLSTFILGVVKSAPFQMRRIEEEDVGRVF